MKTERKLAEKGAFRQVATLHAGEAPSPAATLFAVRHSLVIGDHPQARVSIARAQVGRLSVGRVHSTGHEVVLSEGTAFTLLLPMRGRLVVETQAGELGAQAGEALLLPPGRRRTRVIDTGGGFLGSRS